jgi:hypothetical protein
MSRIDEALAAVYAKLGVDPADVSSNGQAPSPQELALPEDFWDARPAFGRIRQAAQSSGVSPELTVGVVLGRVVAASPHTIEIPGHVGKPCGLSMIVMGVGPPGVSKTAAVGNAIDLVPPGLIDPKVDGIGPGSGEGLIEVLFEQVYEPDPQKPAKDIKVRRQVRFNAFLYGDEAEAVIRQSQRQSSGSTFLANLRSIFTSSAVGQANVGDNFRHLDTGSYVYTIILGVQPTRARAVFDDHGAGTPQRFLWFPAQAAPTDWPDHPGPLNWQPPDAQLLERHKIHRAGRFRHPIDVAPAIVDEVRANYTHRQEHGCDPLDVHRDLVRLKVAGAIILLDRRLTMTPDDWQLAGTILDLSDNTRAGVLAALDAETREVEQARRERDAGREIHKHDAMTGHRTIECARRVADKVHTGGGWTVAKLRRSLSHWHSLGVFDQGLAHAITEGWVIEDAEPGQGTDKRTIRPGSRRPT